MKITSLSEQQRRADARRSVLAMPAHALRRVAVASTSARQVTMSRDAIALGAADQDEERSPSAATSCVAQSALQGDAATASALNRADDDGWPAARGR